MAERTGDLQIDEDVDFQRKEWVAERIAWTVLAVTLVAALLGVFGSGPLSRTTAANAQGNVEVTYERFARKISDNELEATVSARIAEQNSVTLFFSDEWASTMNVQQITPEPDSARRTDEGIYYEFASVPIAPVVVTIQYRPDRVGVVMSTVPAGSGEQVELWQLIYP